MRPKPAGIFCRAGWTLRPFAWNFAAVTFGRIADPHGVATKAKPSKDGDAKLSGLPHAYRVSCRLGRRHFLGRDCRVTATHSRHLARRLGRLRCVLRSASPYANGTDERFAGLPRHIGSLRRRCDRSLHLRLAEDHRCRRASHVLRQRVGRVGVPVGANRNLHSQRPERRRSRWA